MAEQKPAAAMKNVGTGGTKPFMPGLDKLPPPGNNSGFLDGNDSAQDQNFRASANKSDFSVDAPKPSARAPLKGANMNTVGVGTTTEKSSKVKETSQNSLNNKVAKDEDMQFDDDFDNPLNNINEQDQYLNSLTEAERLQYNNLIQKNMKMRGELIEIATQMDVLAGRERAEKASKLYDKFEDDAELADLRAELDQQDKYLMTISARLQERRKLVTDFMKSSDLPEKENTLVYLTRKAEELAKERAGLQKIINKQRQELEENDADVSKIERVDYV